MMTARAHPSPSRGRTQHETPPLRDIAPKKGGPRKEGGSSSRLPRLGECESRRKTSRGVLIRSFRRSPVMGSLIERYSSPTPTRGSTRASAQPTRRGYRTVLRSPPRACGTSGFSVSLRRPTPATVDTSIPPRARRWLRPSQQRLLPSPRTSIAKGRNLGAHREPPIFTLASHAECSHSPRAPFLCTSEEERDDAFCSAHVRLFRINAFRSHAKRNPHLTDNALRTR